MQPLQNAWKIVSLIIVGVLCNAIWYLVAITETKRLVNYDFVKLTLRHLKHIAIIFETMFGRAFVFGHI